MPVDGSAATAGTRPVGLRGVGSVDAPTLVEVGPHARGVPMNMFENRSKVGGAGRICPEHSEVWLLATVCVAMLAKFGFVPKR